MKIELFMGNNKMKTEISTSNITNAKKEKQNICFRTQYASRWLVVH